MTIKQSVNGILARTTGYRLVRTGEPTTVVRPAGAPRPTWPTRQRTRAERKGDNVPHFGPEALEIIRKVRPRTMTPGVRVFGLIQAVRYVVEAGIPGDIVECGVWRGGSMQAAAYTLQEAGDTSRDLHLYDTFEGMPPPTEEDVRRDGRTAAEMLARTTRKHPVWAYATLEDVQAGMAETGYPTEHIHYHRGMVEETIPAQAPEQISILRLDTDWYASTKHELEQLYPRLAPGGVLILDDYGHWEGARKATEEFLATLDHPILLLPLGEGRIATKPR